MCSDAQSEGRGAEEEQRAARVGGGWLERRGYEELGRSEGRFCGLPAPTGAARLRLVGQSEDVAGSGMRCCAGS